MPPADFAWTDRHATPSSLTDGGLRAHRWAIVLGAVAIPTFWVLDRLQGLVYNDRLAYRLALLSTQRGPYASSSASVSRPTSWPTALAAVRLHDGLGKPYGMVLTDAQMPEMDGLGATRLIRADSAPTQPRSLALAANATVGDREACLAASADDDLSTPVKLEALRDVLLDVGQIAAGIPAAPVA